MKTLKSQKVSLNRVLVLDIETVRKTETFGELDENSRLAFRYKVKNDGVIPDDREVAKLYTEKASFYPEFSKICSIGVVFQDKEGNQLLSQSFTSTDEIEILGNLSALLSRVYKADPEYRIAGHNLFGFDVPFLCKRYIYNRLEIPNLIDETGVAKWNLKNLDTLDLLKVGAYNAGTSLVAAAVACGLEIPKDEMAGEDVAKHYFAGNLAEIDKYVVKDCVTCFNLLATMMLEKTYLFDEVIDVSSLQSDKQALEEMPQMPCLNQLYITKEFSDEIKEEIRDRFLNRKKKVMKKEWPMLETMLTSLYINTAFIGGDKDDVVKEKTTEVSEFVEQIKKEYYA